MENSFEPKSIKKKIDKNILREILKKSTKEQKKYLNNMHNLCVEETEKRSISFQFDCPLKKTYCVTYSIEEIEGEQIENILYWGIYFNGRIEKETIFIDTIKIEDLNPIIQNISRAYLF